MKATFKPKKAFIHVPGFGVVTREEFSPEHTAALLERAKKHKVNQDEFISQHLVISGYGDLEIFSGPEDNGKGEAEDVKMKGKKGKKKEELSDEEQLEKLIAEEESKKS